MAQSITITIQNDAKAIELLNAFCFRFGYQDTIANPAFDDLLPVDPQTNPLSIPNPQSKKNFIKENTILWWREIAVHGKRKEMEQSFVDQFDEGNIIID